MKTYEDKHQLLMQLHIVEYVLKVALHLEMQNFPYMVESFEQVALLNMKS